MNRALYRYLANSLLWLLVAALPLQGFAAAMRTCCLQQDSAAQAVAVMAVMEVKAATPHCHDMADMTDMAMPMQIDDHDGKTMAHGHDCGNHGACTVAASAPPPMSVLQPLSLRAPRLPVASAPLFAGHIPSGPERPPRSPRSA